MREQLLSGSIGYGEYAALSAAEFEGAKRAITGRAATAFEVNAHLLSEFPTAHSAVRGPRRACFMRTVPSRNGSIQTARGVAACRTVFFLAVSFAVAGTRGLPARQHSD
jgi:hypothetical protein